MGGEVGPGGTVAEVGISVEATVGAIVGAKVGMSVGATVGAVVGTEVDAGGAVDPSVGCALVEILIGDGAGDLTVRRDV